MERTQSFPLGFKILMERLHDAQRELSLYCELRDEPELALFFDPANGCGCSLREISDDLLDVLEPSFGRLAETQQQECRS